MKGFVSNIQRFSINDGPGIRTTIFLKGCNLRCRWCHNPESISLNQEIQYFPQQCMMCGKCIELCPISAHYIDNSGEKTFERSKCIGCGICVENCMFDALVHVGRYMNSDEVVEIVLKDAEYYKNSGGGITFSGGEPLLQKEFVKEVFEKTRSLRIHNALDTAANANWEDIKYLLPVIDMVLLDIKLMDSQKHKEVTGVTNEKILENAVRLSEENVDIIVRIPVIPGINDTQENMDRTADFLKDFKRLLHVELLSYHDMGVDKYSSLGKSSKGAVFDIPTCERMEALSESFKRYSIETIIG